jgi:hypothetical protein
MKKIWIVIALFMSSIGFSQDKFNSVEGLKLYVNHYLSQIPGWCTSEKAEKFIDLILKIKPDVCVDIGTFGGSSLFPVASALKYLERGIVIGIDAWDRDTAIRNFDINRDKNHLEFWSNVNFDQIYYIYLNILRAHALNDYCITLRSNSEAASYLINEIDFLYLDGNHSEEVSQNDVVIYLPKVRSGGYICINDCSDPHLQHAIDALMEECEFIDLFDDKRALLLRKK